MFTCGARVKAVNSLLQIYRRFVTIGKRAVYAQNSIKRQTTLFDNARRAME